MTGSGRNQTSGLWRRVLAHRPSPATIIALLAMFIAMGGTGYAVTKLPKRSVGSLQLKKGAVRKENIANGAVTASKLSKGLIAAAPTGSAGPASAPVSPSDSVGYADKAGWADNAGKADRATLADKATTATTAGSATTATSATTAGTAGNANTLNGRDSSYYLTRNTVVDLPRFTLTNGQKRVILTSGPFTYTASCDINTDGTDTAQILVSSTENHSAFDGIAINPDLLTNSPELARLHAIVETQTGKPGFKAEDDGTAVAPSGSEIRSITWYVGVNLFNTTGRCTFGGFAIL
jgi:hypothetical protein